MTSDEAKVILGCTDSKTAHKAFRMRAKAGMYRHPDVGGDAERFQQLCEAYDVLAGHSGAAAKVDLGTWTRDAGLEFERSGVSTIMAKSKESALQIAMKLALEKSGAFVFNCHGSEFQRAGMPDLWIAHHIWTGWLELVSAMVWRWWSKEDALWIQIPTGEQFDVYEVLTLRDVDTHQRKDGEWILKTLACAESSAT